MERKRGEKRPKVVKITEAIRLLRAAGFVMVTGRKGKHDIWIHPNGKETTLSRGSAHSLSVAYTKQIFEEIDSVK